MRHEGISADLERLAFLFFYKYSRFEFALKQNGYLRDSNPGNPAMPDWYKFAEERCSDYRVSVEAAELIGDPPKYQAVAANGLPEWKHVDLVRYADDIGKVIRLLQTVRNNLFHGGKHGAEGWDRPGRTERLLTLGATVLDQIAEESGLQGDYIGFY